jgi:hypothetical protein
VFKDGDTYYLYPSDAFGKNGIPVYSAKDPFGQWHYEGIAARVCKLAVKDGVLTAFMKENEL